jgi:hypothetical protein
MPLTSIYTPKPLNGGCAEEPLDGNSKSLPHLCVPASQVSKTTKQNLILSKLEKKHLTSCLEN